MTPTTPTRSVLAPDQSAPEGTLLTDFSSPGARPVPWDDARALLESAEVWWVSTVRPDGRPHVTPLLTVWAGGALHFCTGPAERKALNLETTPHVALTTGTNLLREGFDVVVEGTAVRVTDEPELRQLAERWRCKYDGWEFDVRAGSFWNEVGGEAYVFAVEPRVVLGFTRGEEFAAMRWRRPSPEGAGRTDRGSRVVQAPPADVYRALLDARALESWLPPDGMTGRMERFEPWVGGGYRMVLTYTDPASSPGKSSEATDVVEVALTELVPDERVVQQVEFASDDPAYAGVMTMTWQLDPAEGATRVRVRADDVPPGIVQADHEAGIASSLANLDAYLAAHRTAATPQG